MTSAFPQPGAAWRRRFLRALLRWYAHHKRDLPWRSGDDPYAVWISEMLLQQTRVAQARPYFERFMARFPTVEALASARVEEVLKAWEGLGYYARARHLHRAAGQVAEKYGGRIPEDVAAISALPGVGPYTAAAVLSIAYNKDHAAVDGNVIRVLCRLFRITGDPSRPSVRRMLTGLADRLLERGRAADFNQAMMELGATVCTPRRPRCGACPVNDLCRACQETADPSALPQKAPRKPRPHYDVTAALIRHEGRLLIVQRPPDGLLGGLWEFPGGRRLAEESLEESLVRTVAESAGLRVRIDRHLAAIPHGFTHFEMTLYGYCCTCLDGDPRAAARSACRWVAPEQLSDFPFSTACHRLIDALHEEAARRQLSLFE